MIRLPQTRGVAWDSYKILAGSYDVPFLKFTGVPRVLDIGANVGAFSMWARQKWPGCPIRAFEPQSKMWPFYLANTRNEAALIRKAVWPETPVTLYTKKDSDLLTGPIKGSYHDGPEMKVDAVHPKDLPECEVLKIDTEGAEVKILENYPHKPSLILLEAHGEADRWQIEDILKKDYEWVLGEMWTHGYCEMKFVRRDLLTQEDQKEGPRY